MKVPQHIFRKYDIRGLYPEDINKDNAYLIGLAIGSIFKARGYASCALGWDNRDSSEALRDSVSFGLSDMGINVKQLGIVPTPLVYFMTCEDDVDCGVQITASHNPKQFNGVKSVHNDAYKFAPEETQEIYKRVLEFKEQGISLEDRFEDASATASGEISDFSDAVSRYVSYFVNHFEFDRPLKVVLGCGHGSCSEIAPLIFESLGCEVISEDCFLDSDFPNGMANPEDPAFMERLSSLVTKHDADLGIGFDSDGDRVGFIDEKGRPVPMAEVLALFTQEVMEVYPGEDVIYDVKFSPLVGDVIESLGGNPIQVATGHPNIDPRIKGGAALGAEFSAHIYFGHVYRNHDDGIYAAARLLKVLDARSKPLSSLVGFLPERSSSPEYKIPCPEEDKWRVIDSLVDTVKKDFSDVLTLDGVKARLTKGAWFLIRASNTSPYLSVRMEGSSPEELEMVKSNVLQILRKHPVLDLTSLV
ncbi:hypothetical protein GF360_02530 [candidate division WWE3 bacterium]|nr:hypothetical protein [candidate division WWE3 bacterium]